MVTPPVLYWVYLTQDSTDNPRLWMPSEKYDGRVELLDNNPNTSSKSILLKNVQWADSGKYQCKVSVITEGDRFRRRGNDTLLMVYGKYKVLEFSFPNISGSNVLTGR